MRSRWRFVGRPGREGELTLDVEDVGDEFCAGDNIGSANAETEGIIG